MMDSHTTDLDRGLTHIALPVLDVDRSSEFYAKYAGMQIVHRRIDAETGVAVVWLSDRTRPFVLVLIQKETVHPVLSPLAHLGVGCNSRAELDALCDAARRAGVLLQEPKDSGYPIGYWAFLRDPDGHTLELSYGQEIGLTVDGAIDRDDRNSPIDRPSAIASSEEKLRQAMLDSDVLALDELIADDLIFTAPHTGHVVDKQTDLTAHRTGTIDFTQIDILDRQVQHYDNCAIVAVKTQLAGRQNGQAFTGNYCYTRVWVKLQDRWQIGGGHVSQVTSG
jgi:catechol 2,3-dioxygenase-like lactoylglutathione lyase family enzyme/ketosteroid isomerase-like protein